MLELSPPLNRSNAALSSFVACALQIDREVVVVLLGDDMVLRLPTELGASVNASARATGTVSKKQNAMDFISEEKLGYGR